MRKVKRNQDDVLNLQTLNLREDEATSEGTKAVLGAMASRNPRQLVAWSHRSSFTSKSICGDFQLPSSSSIKTTSSKREARGLKGGWGMREVFL